MFKPNHKYRHVNTLDMDLFIVKVSYRGPKYYKMRVLYIDRRSGNLYCHAPETVKVNREDFKNWFDVSSKIR